MIHYHTKFKKSTLSDTRPPQKFIWLP